MNLPNDIINLIYTFNPEHRPMYKKVLNELFTVTSLWKVNFDHIEITDLFKTQYNLSFKQARSLSNYWNDQFLLQHPYAKKSYSKYYNHLHQICSLSHLSDLFSIKTYFPIIINNIQSYKITSKYKNEKI